MNPQDTLLDQQIKLLSTMDTMALIDAIVLSCSERENGAEKAARYTAKFLANRLNTLVVIEA